MINAVKILKCSRDAWQGLSKNIWNCERSEQRQKPNAGVLPRRQAQGQEDSVNEQLQEQRQKADPYGMTNKRATAKTTAIATAGPSTQQLAKCASYFAQDDSVWDVRK